MPGEVLLEGWRVALGRTSAAVLLLAAVSGQADPGWREDELAPATRICRWLTLRPVEAEARRDGRRAHKVDTRGCASRAACAGQWPAPLVMITCCRDGGDFARLRLAPLPDDRPGVMLLDALLGLGGLRGWVALVRDAPDYEGQARAVLGLEGGRRIAWEALLRRNTIGWDSTEPDYELPIPGEATRAIATGEGVMTLQVRAPGMAIEARYERSRGPHPGWAACGE